MKVALVNRSDSTGGAAVVTYRLMQALRAAGVDARMLVLEKLTDDPNVISYASPLTDKYNFLAERWNIFTRNGFSRENLFKVDTASHGRNIVRHKWIKEADVVMLNWVNQGALSLRAISQLCDMGKPVIWTMHDMWPFTGICHHAMQCTEYQHACRGCQYLNSIKVDLSTSVQSQKSKMYTLHPDAIHFVAVSNWLADCCRKSRLLRNEPMSVIYNPLDTTKFQYLRQERGDLGIDLGKVVIALGSARLDDSMKGFDLLISATQYLRLSNKQLADKLHLLLFGNIRDHSLLNQLEIPYTHLGTVKGVDSLVNIYTQADIVLSTSRIETFGATLAEGQACGCTPVALDSGGQADIIDHLKTGYLVTATKEDELPAAIADGIAWAANARLDRQMLHNTATAKFSSATIAQQYIALCNQLLSAKYNLDPLVVQALQ